MREEAVASSYIDQNRSTGSQCDTAVAHNHYVKLNHFWIDSSTCTVVDNVYTTKLRNLA